MKNLKSGVSFNESSIKNYFYNCTFRNNYDGLKTYPGLSSLFINNCKIESNVNYGIYMMNTNFFKFFSHLDIDSTNINNHLNFGGIYATGYHNMRIFRVNFNDNLYDIYSINENGVVHLTDLIVTKHRIENYGIYCLSIYKTRHLTLDNSVFAKLKTGILFAFYLDSSFDINVRNNTIRGCQTYRKLIAVSIGQDSKFSFYNNSLINNSPKFKTEIQHFPFHTSAAIWIYSRRSQVLIHENTFLNPKMDYEFVGTTYNGNTAIANAARNYWGDNNIYRRTLTFHNAFSFIHINYFPFYENIEKSRLSFKSQSNNDNDTLFGEVQGHRILEAGKYFVKGKVVIPENSRLTINDGVSIDFYSQSGFVIYGRLDILGSKSSSIIFKSVSLNKKKTFGNFILDDKLLVYYNKSGIIYPVSYQISNEVCEKLCIGLGYSKNFEKLRNYQSSEKKIIIEYIFDWNLKNYHTKLREKDNSLILHCQDTKWSGIHFLASSKKSSLTGFTIQDVEANHSPLYFELLRHNLKNVRVESESKSNLHIENIYPFEKVLFENIELISESTSRLIIKNQGHLTMKNFYLKNFLINNIIEKPSRNIFMYNRQIKEFQSFCSKKIFLKLGEKLTLQDQYYYYYSNSRDACKLNVETEVNAGLRIYVYSHRYYSKELVINAYDGKHLVSGEEFKLLIDDYWANITNSYDDDFENYLVIESIEIDKLQEIDNRGIFKIENGLIDFNEYEAIKIVDNNKENNSTITLSNVTFNSTEYRRTGIYLRVDNHHDKEVFIENCKFFNNEFGISFDHRKYENFNIFINNSTFVNTPIVKKLYEFNSYKNFKTHKFTLENSRITGNYFDDIFQSGIYGLNNKREEFKSFVKINKNIFEEIKFLRNRDVIQFQAFHQLAITNNIFKNISNCQNVLEIFYDGGIINLSGNSYEKVSATGSLEDIQQSYYTLRSCNEFQHIANIYKNVDAPKTTYLHAHTCGIKFENNFYENITTNILVYLSLTGKIKDEMTIFNNRFINNKGKYTIFLNGDSIPKINGNLFKNSKMVYEIKTSIYCFFNFQNDCVINATDNFWNSEQPLQKIFSRKNDGYLVDIDISPFFLDENKIKRVNLDKKEYYNYSSLSGVVDTPIEINSDFSVSGNIVFEKNVVINKGVKIQFNNCPISAVFKGKLTIKGTSNYPVIFHRKRPSITLRLDTNNILQILRNKNWVNVIFPYKYSYEKENQIFCKYFCLVSDGSASGTYNPYLTDYQTADCLSFDDTYESCLNRTFQLGFSKYMLSLNCKKPLRNKIFVFQSKEKSLLEHVQFYNVGLSFIRSYLPYIHNISWYNLSNPFQVIWSAQSETLKMDNLKFEDIKGNGVYLLNNNHKTEVKSSTFRRVENGIFWQETKNSKISTLNNQIISEGLWSPFTFCSAEKKFFLLSNDIGYWYDSKLATFKEETIQCSAIFQSPKYNFIHIDAKCPKCKFNEFGIFRIYDTRSNSLKPIAFFLKDEVFCI